MSNRNLRVNELIQRELSAILHTRYQSEAAAITITAVDVAPDLHDGRVFFSVIGSDEMVESKKRWIRTVAGELQKEVSRRVVLKYLPKLRFIVDDSTARGIEISRLIDELGPMEEEKKEEEQQ